MGVSIVTLALLATAGLALADPPSLRERKEQGIIAYKRNYAEAARQQITDAVLAKANAFLKANGGRELSRSDVTGACVPEHVVILSNTEHEKKFGKEVGGIYDTASGQVYLPIRTAIFSNPFAVANAGHEFLHGLLIAAGVDTGGVLNRHHLGLIAKSPATGGLGWSMPQTKADDGTPYDSTNWFQPGHSKDERPPEPRIPEQCEDLPPSTGAPDDETGKSPCDAPAPKASTSSGLSEHPSAAEILAHPGADVDFGVRH